MSNERHQHHMYQHFIYIKKIDFKFILLTGLSHKTCIGLQKMGTNANYTITGEGRRSLIRRVITKALSGFSRTLADIELTRNYATFQENKI